MKRTLSVLFFSLSLPLGVSFYIYLTTHSNPTLTLGDAFPILPEEVEDKKWLAVLIKPECPSCRNLLAQLASYWGQYHETDFPVIAFSIGDRLKTQSFMNLYSFHFPLLQMEKDVIKSIGVGAVPAGFLIDEKGRVRYKWVGEKSPAILNRTIHEFITKGKIPLMALHQERFFPSYPSLETLWPYLEDEPLLQSFMDDYGNHSGSITEYITVQNTNGDAVAYHYAVLLSDCDCEATDSSRYQFVSIIIDWKSDSLIDWHTAADVPRETVFNHLLEQNQLIYGYGD